MHWLTLLVLYILPQNKEDTSVSRRGVPYSEGQLVIADAETLAPGWPRATVGRGGSRTRLDSDPVACHSDSSPTAHDTRDKEPSTTIGEIH